MWLLLCALSFADPAPPDPLAPPADLLAPPADAIYTPSGLAYKVLVPGVGDERARPEDLVVVNYTGWTKDGTAFDSTSRRGQPAEFPLRQLIPGWVEGIQLMAPGSTVRMWIPVGLAYRYAPSAPMGDLVFDVELVRIDKAPEPMVTPADVAAPSAGAVTSASGLTRLVVTPGTGTVHPSPTSTVEIQYAVWARSGRGLVPAQITQLTVDSLTPGLAEAVQSMVVGDRSRFWIPAALAFGESKGDVTVDIRLRKIVR